MSALPAFLLLFVGSFVINWSTKDSTLPAFYSYTECEHKTCGIDVQNFTVKQYVLNRFSVIKSIECSNCSKNCEPNDKLCLNMCLRFSCGKTSNERIYGMYMECLRYYDIKPWKFNMTPIEYIYIPGDGEYAFFEYMCRMCMDCYDSICFLHGDFSKKCRNLCLDINKCPTLF